MAIEAIVLDLDGVIRHFDPDHPTRVERQHGLPPGSLVTAAFAPERILFNTAEIGVAKPDGAVFDHVCRSLDLDPGAVFFTDDSPGHVAGAERRGLVARHFVGPPELRADLDHVL